MSLNWNVQDTDAYKALMETDEESYSQHQRNVLDTLIWATLVVDLPGIPTEEDADEFYFRMRYLDSLNLYSPTIPDPDSIERHLTDDEVEKRGDAYYSIHTGNRAFREPEDDSTWYASTDRALTREDMDEWVGLTTNVSRKSRKQFIHRHAEQCARDVERVIEREQREKSPA